MEQDRKFSLLRLSAGTLGQLEPELHLLVLDEWCDQQPPGCLDCATQLPEMLPSLGVREHRGHRPPSERQRPKRHVLRLR